MNLHRERRMRGRDRKLVDGLPRDMAVKCYRCDGEGFSPGSHCLNFSLCGECDGWGVLFVTPGEQVATV